MQEKIDEFNRTNSIPQQPCLIKEATWAIWTVVDFSEKQKREIYRAINKMMKADYEDG